MLALMSVGGWLAIFIADCKIDSGMVRARGSSGGSAERKQRKSEWPVSAHTSSSFSSLGSQRATSSMFCSITHPPSTNIRSSAFSATGSCPWPSETVTNLPASSVLPSCAPSTRTGTTGSTPGESRKKMGTAGAESSNDTLRLNGIASTYLLPIDSRTHSAIASIMRSGRTARTTCSRWKPPSRFHSCGSGIFSGCSDSIHSFHRFHEPSTSCGRLAKASCDESATTENHAASSSHTEHGFSRSRFLGALMSKSISSCKSSPELCSTFIVSRQLKMRRWRSKRPRVTYEKMVYCTESSSVLQRTLSPSSVASALLSALEKMKLKAPSENWYMWSITFSWLSRK
mmetsp:Transcript_25449/g.58880  ORF Transcript_25449/g.58880 Transcript_25449/m.58880 type:complete len:343 (+) Transcript_25449:1627-2655(+)